MSPSPSCGKSTGGGTGRPTPAPRRACGVSARNLGACRGGRRVVADAVGRCTRVACATVIALVLLGDNISARAPLHSRYEQQAAWQFFSPSPKVPSNPARSAALQQGKVSLQSSPDGKRRGRIQVGSTVAGGSAVSPAQMYRVSRSSGPGRLTLPGETSRELGRDEGLQSPRSAIAGAGRDYPELLTVYSASPTSSIAEEIGEGVVAGGGQFGRPALPVLSEEDLTQLRAGQRVQKQTREGGSGSGSVVVDVRADPDVVLGLLTKYEDYAEMIDTVRRCEVFPAEGSADKRMVEVTVSRFRLNIRVVMSLLRERSMVKFELDPDCTKAGRAVLREATGFFFVESPPDRPGYSRVWMLAKVDVNRFVPGGVVDYAAGRALPRASNWIKPTCEAAQRRKVRGNGRSSGDVVQQ